MGDPRQNVRPGEPLRIAAEQINYLNSLMRASGGFSGGTPRPQTFAPNTVLVKNTTGSTVARFGILGISGIAIDPTNGSLDGTGEADQRAIQFAEEPLLTGVTPTTASHGDRFVIAMEPIASNAIGVCAVGGVIPVRVLVNNTSHRFASVKDNDSTMLSSSDCGVIQLLWVEPRTGSNRWAVGVM